VLTTFVVSDASARRIYRDRGFYLGTTFAGSFVDADNQPGDPLVINEDGGSLELRAGYSFNPVFSIELSIAGARHETSDPNIDMEFAAARLFAHYRFRATHQLRPYLKGGLGGYTLRLEEPGLAAEVTGGGLAFGGGLDYFFNRHFSLGLDYMFNIIEYDDAKVTFEGLSVSAGIDEDGAQSSLGLAFSFYF
jgi:opacity protein-like surface antigen